MKKIFSILILTILFSTQIFAQQMGSKPAQMADAMRDNGKIYVVVGVLLIILIGLFLYLIRLDKKITKVEQMHEYQINISKTKNIS